MILNENETVGQYTVKYLIKSNDHTSTYRVTDSDGVSLFMKLFDMGKIPPLCVEDGVPYEILGSRVISHPNIIKYIADGDYEHGGIKCKYLVTEFLSGTLLSDVVTQNGHLDASTAKEWYRQILEGLNYMQTTPELFHNDITPHNILISVASGGKSNAKIIDLGHVSGSVMGVPPFIIKDLDITYCAPESFTGMYTSKNDSFAATATLYFMLTGKAPWSITIDEDDTYQIIKNKMRAARRQPLDMSQIPEDLKQVILGGLELSYDNRASIKKLLDILAGKATFSAPKSKPGSKAASQAGGGRNTSASAASEGNPAGTSETSDAQEEDDGIEIKRNDGTGAGFKDVAGMEKLKKELTNRVIWVIKDKEKAKKYRITPPNGMLLYGPPGCGKTFFAEKFAEESGFNYMLVNGSDLGSTYIHGTQGKIAELFKKARNNAPIIVCFDEFDSFVPSRKSRSAEHRAEEVNEFLAQLNNCSKDGIFVIGTTNLKEMIDSAVLRKGRLDLQFEVPAPDAETRRAMFEIHLKGRPMAEGMNLDELSEKTEGYASSDIAFIVNEAAMMAALADRLIEQQDLLNAISCNPSSLKNSERVRVGFNK